MHTIMIAGEEVEGVVLSVVLEKLNFSFNDEGLQLLINMLNYYSEILGDYSHAMLLDGYFFYDMDLVSGTSSKLLTESYGYISLFTVFHV